MSFLILVICLVGIPTLGWAAELKKARFTEVIRDVKVTREGTPDTRTAKVNDLFEVPEVIRTGVDSRAEIEAPDKTIARIGSNTVFSFEGSKRVMNLQSGSVLFHSPKGVGGGTIKTAAATAAVTGTTIMVGATSNGGFKLMVMEGSSRVILPSGDNKVLRAGQMTYIIPGAGNLGPTFEFDLQRASQGSDLVEGFDGDLASKEKISNEANKQQRDIEKGSGPDFELPNLYPDPKKKPDQPGPDLPPAFTLSDFLRTYLDQQLSQSKTLNSSTLSDQLVLQISGPVNLRNYVNSSLGINREINFTTSTSYLAGNSLSFPLSTYNLSSFSSLDRFAFFSAQTISFTQSIDFTNGPQNLHFQSLAGNINFTGEMSVNFGGKNATFIAEKNIAVSPSGDGLTFDSNTPNLSFESLTGSITVNSGATFGGQNTTFTARKGNVTMTNPTFNATVRTVIRGYTVNLSDFDISSVTTPLDIYTFTGSYVINSSSLPVNAGKLNIFDSTTGDSTGGPGSVGGNSNVQSIADATLTPP